LGEADKATDIGSDASELLNDAEATVEAVNETHAEEGEGRPAVEVHAELRRKHFGGPRRPTGTQRRAETRD